ncbi:MAG: tetratricopeptide repeat protein [Pyrinomonadaceae bacterium]
MKVFLRYAPLFAFIAFLVSSISAQGEMSDPSGLPTRIGGPSCTNSAGRAAATIAGTFNVTGMTSTGKTPNFSVAVYAGGIFVVRRQLKNGSSFTFYCVPRENVTLVGEVDSSEVSSISLGFLADPPAINRQDVNISWSDQRDKRRQLGIVAAHHAYDRNKTNQKLFDKALDDLEVGKSDSAVKSLRELLENDPRDWVSWTALGNVYFNSNKFEDAEKAFDHSMELRGDYVPALVGDGRACLNLKKSEKAIEVLKAAYAVEPESADVNHYLGEAYFQIRKGSLGVPHMNRAIELDPNGKADLHLRIAALYNVAGAKDLAANEYKLFLQKRPNYPDREKMEKYISENLQKDK